MPNKADNFKKDLLLALIIPSVFGKTLIVYFGSMYSSEPGAGYGYYLIAALLFTFGNLIRFVWKYRNWKDE